MPTETLESILRQRYPDRSETERDGYRQELYELYTLLQNFLRLPEPVAREKVLLRARSHDFTGEFAARAQEIRRRDHERH